MSKFSDLRDAYHAKKAANNAHWEELFSQVVGLAKSFSAFLEIPEHARVTVDGVECPLLIVGKQEGTTFKTVKSKKEYTRQEAALLVDLLLVVEVNEGKRPEKSIVYSLSVEKTGQFYTIRDLARGEAYEIRAGDFSRINENFYRFAETEIQ